MGTKAAGEEEEKCQWVKGRMNWWGGASSFMHVRWWYAILSRSAEQKHFCSGSRECIRKILPRERYFAPWREISVCALACAVMCGH